MGEEGRRRNFETLPGSCRRPWSWIRTAPCWRTRKCGWRTESLSSKCLSLQSRVRGSQHSFGSQFWLLFSLQVLPLVLTPPLRLRPHPQEVPPPQFRLHPLSGQSQVGWGRGAAGSPTFRSARVPRRLELAPLERVVRISAKPTKRLQEALQPILAKHGLSPQQVSLRRVSRVAEGQGRSGADCLSRGLLTCPLSQARSSH